jgi:hypothetical protein
MDMRLIDPVPALLININKIVNHLNELGLGSYDDKTNIVKQTWALRH